MNKRPNCYKCKYRGSVPGSAHSSCKHPAYIESLEDPMAGILAILGSVGRVPPMQARVEDIEVVGDPHGKAKGWFNHPWNFDPVWLEKCSGFIPETE